MLGIVTWLSVKAKVFILLSDLILMSTCIRQEGNGLEIGRGRRSGWKHMEIVWTELYGWVTLFYQNGFLIENGVSLRCIFLFPLREQKVSVSQTVFHCLFEKYLIPENWNSLVEKSEKSH